MRRNVPPHLALLLLWVMLVAGAPAPAAGEPSDDEAVVVDIELECAAPIDRDGLLRIIPAHVGDRLDAGTLDLTRARLSQTELFAQITVEVQPRGDDGVAVVAHLVRKSIVSRIRFHGNHALGDYDLQRVARVHEGTVLTEDLRQAAASRLRERYAEEGFDAAIATIEVCMRSPGEVDVDVRITEGPPLLIDAIDLVGTLPLPLDDVRKATGLKAGDRFTKAQQRRAQTAIVRLFREKQYYEVDVSSSWEPGVDHRGVLHFTVTPGPLFSVDFSGNHELSDAKLLGLMDLPTRPIVTDGTWRELGRRAQRAYQEDGYAFARVDLHIEPGPPKIVQFEVQEGERYHVGGVSFEGRHGVSARQLRAQMGTRRPSWIPWRRGVFLDDVFDDDLKRLWYFYRRQGFEAAEIVDARTRFDAPSGEVFVTVFIEEGPQTIVRHIETDGTEVITGKLPQLTVVEGQPFDPDAMEADRRALVTALGHDGYTQAVVTATVTTEPEPDTVAATVRFAAQPGVQQHLGAIIVQDNFDTHARVITREVPLKRGDPLDPEALLQGQGNIYRLGLFRSVTVRPLETTAGAPVADVAVNVSEKPPGTLQFGGGYNTRDGIRGFGEIGYSNLQGLGRRISLRGEFGFDPGSASFNDYIANLGFREPRLDGTRWTFRSNLLAQRSTRSVDQFSLERFAFIPAIERVVAPGLQIGTEMQFEHNNVFDVKSDVLAFNPSDEGELWTVSVGPFVIFDGRDDAFVPRRGVFDSLRIKYAPGSLGSGVPFIKVLGQHSQYIPLNDELTFVYAIRAGYALAYEGSDQVPIRERFFLGGRTTVRGFDENKIGPLGYAGDPVGGDMVLNLNTELRFPLVGNLGGVVFVDGGGVYLQNCPSGVGLTNCAHSLENFRRSTGPGLRYITPVGQISLEYGFKIDRRSNESIGEVNFSIGNIF